MNVGYAGPADKLPQDRNGVARNAYYGAATIGPHGATVRTTYTCPTAKKANVDAAFCQMYRDAVAGAAANEGITISYQPSGGSLFPLVTWQQADNTLGVCRIVQLPQVKTLFAGDILQQFTLNTDTGGTFTYNLGFALFEYDA